MVKPIAIILSGCGVNDGSEIHESVLTLLALSKAKVEYQCMAPDAPQRRVYDHLTNQEIPKDSRNMLTESARIARGKILDIAKANPDDYSAMIIPGGLGVALNLCDFATQESAYTAHPGVLKFAKAMAHAKKPAGFICIAPALIPLIYPSGVQFTIGNDKQKAQKIASMGANHQNCTVDNIVIDSKHKVISTPAYMLAQTPYELSIGIEKLVNAVVELM